MESSSTDNSPSLKTAKTNMQLGHSNRHMRTVSRVKRLDKRTKVYIDGMLRRAEHKAWCLTHGKTLPPPKLHPVILRVIREWFDLVDDDGSGTLEHHELLAALQAARIPCDTDSIGEMIRLMDANRDGCIGWNEFEAFMMDEFAAGKHLLSGEYVLPSGMALPFGVMIRQLKRTQMLSEITLGGEARRKWMHYDIDLSADDRAVAEAEEAIRLQKAFNETLHNREVLEVEAAQPGSDTNEQQQQQQQQQQQCIHASSNSCQDHVHSSGSTEAAAFQGIRRPSWMSEGHTTPAAAAAAAATSLRSSTAAVRSSAAAAGWSSAGVALSSASATSAAGTAAGEGHVQPAAGVVVVAGVPVATPRLLSPSASMKQHQQRARPSCVVATGSETPPASAAASAAASAKAASAAHKVTAPAVVPRLQLAGISSDMGRNGNNRQADADADVECSAAINRLEVEQGSVLASIRSSYWLATRTTTETAAAGQDGDQLAAAAAAGAGAGIWGGSQQPEPAHRDSVAGHLFQQSHLKQQQLLQRQGGAAGAGSSCCSPRLLLSCSGGATARASTAGEAARSGSSSSQHSNVWAGSPHHVLLPQPCRDEWSVMAAYCLSQQHSMWCGPLRGGDAAAVSHIQGGGGGRTGSSSSSTSKGGRRATATGAEGEGLTRADYQLLAQQQQAVKRGGLTDRPYPAAAAVPSPAAFMQAVAAAKQAEGSYNSYRDACVKHLLSAKLTPPSALLSQNYVGAVTAAVAAAHTPRGALATAAAAAAAGIQLQPGSSGAEGAAAAAAAGRQQCQRAPVMAGDVGLTQSPQHATAAAAAQQSISTPRSARLVATNQGGALVTEQGGLMRILELPGGQQQQQQRAELVAKSAVAAANAVAATAACKARADLQAAAAAAPAVAAATAAGSSGLMPCGKEQQVNRHSALAQRLVKPHKIYQVYASSPSSSSNSSSSGGGRSAKQQLQQQTLDTEVLDRTGGSRRRRITAGSSCSSMKQGEGSSYEVHGELYTADGHGSSTGSRCKRRDHSFKCAAPSAEASNTLSCVAMGGVSFKEQAHGRQQAEGQHQNLGSKTTNGLAARTACRLEQHEAAAAAAGSPADAPAAGPAAKCGPSPAGRRGSNSCSGSLAAARAAVAKQHTLHYAASGPLGGHHPAYANSYIPLTWNPSRVQGGATCRSGIMCSRSLTGDVGCVAPGAPAVAAGGGAGAGGSRATVKKAVVSSPRLSYSGLSPRGRKS